MQCEIHHQASGSMIFRSEEWNVQVLRKVVAQPVPADCDANTPAIEDVGKKNHNHNLNFPS